MPAAAAPSAQRISVAGGDIAFDVAGAAPRGVPSIVLLHGWALDRRLWAPQVAELAVRRQVIAIDRRGFGESTAPPDLSREADDVAAILDFAGIAKAIVVGMSQAGRVAADFALRHADRAAGVVFQGARLGSFAAAASADMPIATYAGLVRSGRLAELKAAWRAHPLMRLADQAWQPLVDRMLAAYRGDDLLAAPAPPDLDDAALAGIAVPALFVTGAGDTALRRRIADHLSQTVPGAERVEIAGAGHLCNLCAPASFNRAIEDFVARTSAVTAKTF